MACIALFCEVKVSARRPVTPYSDWGNGKLYKLKATKDVWLEGNSNKNYHKFLIVGKHPSYPIKRFLIQFENIPSGCTRVLWAKMYIYYYSAHKASWQTVRKAPYISRLLQVHRIKKNWNERQATAKIRQANIPWSKPYLDLTGCDADPYTEDTVPICTARPFGYIEFNVTRAAQKWKSGYSNYGVVVWATNEKTNGRDHRFYSREKTKATFRPFIHVLCSYDNPK